MCCVQATDDDEHSSTEYHITDGDPLNNFTINSTTGRVGVSAPLDFEKIPASWNGTYRLTVMATDSQQPSLYDVTTVLIHVIVSTVNHTLCHTLCHTPSHSVTLSITLSITLCVTLCVTLRHTLSHSLSLCVTLCHIASDTLI